MERGSSGPAPGWNGTTSHRPSNQHPRICSYTKPPATLTETPHTTSSPPFLSSFPFTKNPKKPQPIAPTEPQNLRHESSMQQCHRLDVLSGHRPSALEGASENTPPTPSLIAHCKLFETFGGPVRFIFRGTYIWVFYMFCGIWGNCVVGARRSDMELSAANLTFLISQALTSMFYMGQNTEIGITAIAASRRD